MSNKKSVSPPLQTLNNGIEILNALTKNGEPMLLTEIAKAVNMPPGKAHRYLSTLVASGMLEQNEVGGEYDFGPRLLKFGLAALDRLTPLKTVQHHLEKLSSDINESVLYAIWAEHGPTIVLMKESGQPVSLNVRVGSVLPLLTSSTGMVFSAYLPEEKLNNFIVTELDSIRQSERQGLPVNEKEVEELQETVKRRGLARVLGTYQVGINAFSAPIFNYESRLEGVITGVGHAGSFDTNWNGHVAKSVKKTAKTISNRLGYDG